MDHLRIIVPSEANKIGGVRALPAGKRLPGQIPENAIPPRIRVDTRFQVTALATTRQGTIAALKSAAILAKNLGAPLTLAMTEVLKPHVPLKLPAEVIEFFERRAFGFVSDAGIRDQAVTIRIWFCRNQKKCLRQALSPQTLVVLGGTKRWWARDDQKLEEWLGRQGYLTVFADADAKTYTEIVPQPQRRAFLHQVVKNPDKKIAFPGAH